MSINIGLWDIILVIAVSLQATLLSYLSHPEWKALKFPLIVVVVLFLIVIKKWLHGVMTVFPIVGVIATYEARYSLWTIGRQIPKLMFTMIPMMVTCRLIQSRIGLGLALLVGWMVFLSIMLPLTWSIWSTAGRRQRGKM